MKCPNCGRDVPDQSIFCGYCGTRIENAPPAPPAQSESQPSGLPSFEVSPVDQSSSDAAAADSTAFVPQQQPDTPQTAPAPGPIPPAAPQPPSGNQSAAPQQPPSYTPPQQPAYTPPAQPVYTPPTAPQPVTASMNEGDTPAPRKNNAVIAIIAVIGLAAVIGIALAIYHYVVPLFSGSGSEATTMAVFRNDEGMMAANGNKVLALGEDTADYDGWSPLCYTADGKRFVYFDDVEDGLGTLFVGPAGGKAEEVDSDVIIGEILVTPGAVMYEVQDGSDVVLRLYNGKDVIDLTDDPQSVGTWCCSDDGSFASYMVYDKNGDSAAYYWYDGEEYSLSKNTSVIYIFPNGKGAYAVEYADEYYDEIATLYALTDIKQTEAVPVGEDIGPLAIDASTNAVAFLGDYDPSDETGDLYYARFGKEAVELDNKVSELRYFGQGGYMTSAGEIYGGVAYSVAPDFNGELYYVRKDTLYATPFKTDREIELIDDVSISGISMQMVNGTLYWQDDRDIMSYKAGSLKDPESWRPDAAADGFMVLKNNSILSEEDNELFIQAYGSEDDAQSIMDDVEDYDFAGMSPDEKYIYFMDADELLFIPTKGGKETSVTDDIDDIYMTTGGIYLLVDYDSDKGGEVLYVAYGKTKTVSIAEDILDLSAITYLP